MRGIVFLSILLSLLFSNCNNKDNIKQHINSEIKIKIQYPKEYFCCIINWIDIDKGNVWGFFDKDTIEINKDNLIEYLETLDYLEVSVYKLYKPYDNDLLIELYKENNLIKKSIASYGIRKTILEYQF